MKDIFNTAILLSRKIENHSLTIEGGIPRWKSKEAKKLYEDLIFLIYGIGGLKSSDPINEKYLKRWRTLIDIRSLVLTTSTAADFLAKK